MKRVFLALVAVFASIVAFAGNPLKVTNSTVALKQFMKEQANATLVIDWSKAQYDNKKSASAEFGADYNFIKDDCVNKLIEGFNAKSKGVKLTKDKKGTDYKGSEASQNRTPCQMFQRRQPITVKSHGNGLEKRAYCSGNNSGNKSTQRQLQGNHVPVAQSFQNMSETCKITVDFYHRKYPGNSGKPPENTGEGATLPKKQPQNQYKALL